MIEQEGSQGHSLHKYLFYVEIPRQRRRVTVSAEIHCLSHHSALSGMRFPFIFHGTHKSLPGDLQQQLESVLRQSKMFETVTNIALSTTEDNFGLMADQSKVGITEDLTETTVWDHATMLCDMRDMRWPVFLQSQVAVRSRHTVSSYLVQIHSQLCFEQKLAVAGARLPGNNADVVRDFFNEIRPLRSIRGCSGIIKLAGIVLDDARKHLMSYLYKAPALGKVRDI